MTASLSTATVKDGNGNAIAGGVRSIDESGVGTGPFKPVAAIVDGSGVANTATVSAFHSSDNQNPGSTAYGLFTGGVAQLLNAQGYLDRQRNTGADQAPSQGIATGAASFAQEVLTTTTTTVSAAATTATLLTGNTSGFQVGGTLNFEPGTSRYESARISAVVTNTSVAVAFASGGAAYTHTQPYAVQTFLYNQERDFSGEGPSTTGVGAATAAEFESSSGGAPLTSGLASGVTLDVDRNVQGKSNTQMAITSTTAGNTTLVFTNNPWVAGLVTQQKVYLSSSANGAVVEELVISKNNAPAAGAGPITVTLVNPVVNSGSTYATFDIFGTGVPSTATVHGVGDTILWLNDSAATDPKRPLKAALASPGSGGVLAANTEGNKATFTTYISDFGPVATATDIFVLPGSASKTLRVTQVRISGDATAAASLDLYAYKRTAANTGGTSASATITLHDSNDTATAVPVSYSVNPTGLGTGTLIRGVARWNFPAAGTPSAQAEVVWDFTTRNSKGLVLRGTAQSLAINLNGQTIPSGLSLYVFIEWTEE